MILNATTSVPKASEYFQPCTYTIVYLSDTNNKVVKQSNCKMYFAYFLFTFLVAWIKFSILICIRWHCVAIQTSEY